MKKCPMCGIEVEDHASECPECGCPIADTSGFSLKSNPGTKKKTTNPMGKSMSSGTGLTDVLREGDDAYDDYDDDNAIGGSIPLSLSRLDIEGDYSAKKKGKAGKIIIRLILLAALVAGAYFIVTNYLMRDKAKSYEEALKYYIDAINNVDDEKMQVIIPPYIKDNESMAEDYVNSMKVLHINDYNTRNIEKLTDSDIDNLTQAIKLDTGKTAKIREGYRVDLELKVTVIADSSQYANGSSFLIKKTVEFIRIKDNWYLQINAYDNIDYN
ncbi:MAG: zinc ribbon domain-containing protein [Lachnospiraceae bacterium]|nr:zinc ribbon domain-containing protein [Lachnospiraceae bacterium]